MIKTFHLNNVMAKGLFVLSLVALASCAKAPGNKDAYQANSDLCSTQFVSEWNRFVREISRTNTANRNDILEAKNTVKAFKSKYADVNCKAAELNSSFSREDQAEMMINVNEKTAQIESALDAALDNLSSNQRRNSNPNRGRSVQKDNVCSDELSNEFSALMQDYENAISYMHTNRSRFKTELKQVRAGFVNFQKKHAQVKCLFSENAARGGIDVDQVSKIFIDHANEILDDGFKYTPAQPTSLQTLSSEILEVI